MKKFYDIPRADVMCLASDSIMALSQDTPVSYDLNEVSEGNGYLDVIAW